MGAMGEPIERTVGEDWIVEEGDTFVDGAITGDDRGGGTSPASSLSKGAWPDSGRARGGGMFLITWRIVSENSAATGGMIQKNAMPLG